MSIRSNGTTPSKSFAFRLACALVAAVPTVTFAALPQPNPNGVFQAGTAAVTDTERGEAVRNSADTESLTLQQAYELAFRRDPGALAPRIDGAFFGFRPGVLFVLDDRIVMLSGGYPLGADCTVCEGTIAVHYFARVEGRWTVAGEWLDRIRASAEPNSPPDLSVEHRFLSVPVVKAFRYTGVGPCEANSYELYAFAEDGPVAIGSYPSGINSGDHESNPDGFRAVWGTVTRYRRDWSFEIGYVGELRGEEVDADIAYRWTGERYEAQQPLPDFGSC